MPGDDPEHLAVDGEQLTQTPPSQQPGLASPGCVYSAQITDFSGRRDVVADLARDIGQPLHEKGTETAVR